jgi:peroxiredoxin
MKALGRDLPKFTALHTQVLGISYDAVTRNHDFALHCAADFPFLSDDSTVATKYEDAKSFVGFKVAGRRTVLIDRKGLVRRIYDGMPDDDQILKDLAATK